MQIEFVQPFGDTSNYNVRIDNKYFGTLEPKEDGYWDWWPPNLSPAGYIPADILRAIANKLDELNKDWNEHVEKYFAGQL